MGDGKMELKNISFDESYKNLFQVDDPRLRADALKHSILPRLHLVLNDCIYMIKRVYDIEALEDSRVSDYPSFRSKRETELEHLYEAAYVGLSGKQMKGKWHGVERKDGKPVQLLPFRYGLQLTEEGLVIFLENYWVKGLTDESHKKLFDFHLEFESLIHVLCYQCNMRPALYYGEDVEPISTFRQLYECMLRNKIFENNFGSEAWAYPITSEALLEMAYCFVHFYPVYDSYLQIAMGNPVRFSELIAKLNKRKRETDKSEDEVGDSVDETVVALSEEMILKAKEAAEQKIKVMPAIRWQVFQRDDWKCVACGRGSQNDVILHVDHIVPRSKGGKDTLENYQTLCSLCNIGKSNKDATDLRNRNNIVTLVQDKNRSLKLHKRPPCRYP